MKATIIHVNFPRGDMEPLLIYKEVQLRDGRKWRIPIPVPLSQIVVKR